MCNQSRTMIRPRRPLARFRKFVVPLLAILFTGLFPSGARGQDADRKEIEALVHRFFAAYQKRDLAGIMALWEGGSPDLATARESFEKTFGPAQSIQVKNLEVMRIDVSGQRAMVRVGFELAVTDSKSAGKGEA